MSDGIVQLPPYWRETEPTDYRAASPPWHLADPEIPRHWDRTNAGEGVLVGVADTGIDDTHRELAGRVQHARSFCGGDHRDRNGHGTHVATTIAGNSVGVAPRARLACAKVLADNGAGRSVDVAAGIDWLVDVGCSIINLSLGGSSDDPWTRGAVLRAIDAGVVVVAATGNERASRVSFPARHCVAVGAVDRRLRLADFCNRGKDVDLVGYGVEILAGLPGNQYAAWSGTSMATPWIAGIGALRQAAELRLGGAIQTRTPADLLKLETFVVDLGPEGRDTSYGRGMPDLDRALYELIAAPPPPAEPHPGRELLTVHAEDPATGRVWTGNLRLRAETSEVYDG